MPWRVIDAAPAGTSARTVASSPGEPVLFKVTFVVRGYESRIAGRWFTNVISELRRSIGLWALPGSELAGAVLASAVATASVVATVSIAISAATQVPTMRPNCFSCPFISGPLRGWINGRPREPCQHSRGCGDCGLQRRGLALSALDSQISQRGLRRRQRTLMSSSVIKCRRAASGRDRHQTSSSRDECHAVLGPSLVRVRCADPMAKQMPDQVAAGRHRLRSGLRAEGHDGARLRRPYLATRPAGFEPAASCSGGATFASREDGSEQGKAAESADGEWEQIESD